MDSYGFAIRGPKPNLLVSFHAEHYSRTLPGGTGRLGLRGVVRDVIDLSSGVKRASCARKTGIEQITKLGTRLDLHGDSLSSTTERQPGLGVGSDVWSERL